MDELGRDGVFQLMSSHPSNGGGAQQHSLTPLEATQGAVSPFSLSLPSPSSLCVFFGPFFTDEVLLLLLQP